MKHKSDVSPVTTPDKKVAKLSTLYRSPSGGSENAPSHHHPQPVSSPSVRRRDPRANSAELVKQTTTTIAMPMPMPSVESAFHVVAGNLVRCVDDDQSKHLAAFLT